MFRYRFARFFIKINYIRFAASYFHFIEHPKFMRISF